MGQHAKFSPSKAKRLMTCPASMRLSEGIPNRTSPYAEEGTRAHELAVELFYRRPAPAGTSVEMIQNTMVYVQELDAIKFAAGTEAQVWIEEQVAVNADIYGTADAIIWAPSTSTLYVRDLKYGAGVAVEVAGNVQLKIYALAALLTTGVKAKIIDIGIVQPRCPHQDGPVRTTQYDATELLDFWDDLVAAHALALSPDGPVVPSDECRWCPANGWMDEGGKFRCPSAYNRAQALAKQVFSPEVPYDPVSLGETLGWLALLEGFITNVRQFAYDEAEKGVSIPGWKLVPKRASRKWRDPVAAEAALRERRGPWMADYINPPTLRTPAQIEGMLPKSERSILDDLVVKESSGHALVPESDRREAVKLDAKSAFSIME